MNFLLPIAFSILAGLGTFVGAYKYMPLSWLDTEVTNLGSTITTINGSDTLSASRSVINTNFSNLNADKAETTVTSLASLTSAASLATIGTITTGVWNGTPVTVPYGGTGSTTLSSNQVLLGNGTGIVNTVVGWGTSGQFLTSNGGTSAPTWTTGAVDTTANYNWTGTNLFKNLNASSTVANPIVLNGVSYSTPTSNSLGILRNDGTGALTWSAPVRYVMASTTAYNIQASGATGITFATSTVLGIPAGTLTASSTIKVSGSFDCVDSGGSAGKCSVFLRLTDGTELGGMSDIASPGSNITQNAIFDIDVYQDNSVSAQRTLSRAVQFQSGASTASLISHNDSSSSVNFASAQQLVVVFKVTSNSGGTTNTLQVDNFVVEVNP